jgi:hypothetical protein
VPQIIFDAESRSLGERFVLIRAPRKRGIRYPAGCVTEVADEPTARQAAELARHLHAAVVYGPSRSSEGQQIYYLVRWLD